MQRFGFVIAFALVVCLLLTSLLDFAELSGVQRWWQNASQESSSVTPAGTSELPGSY